MKRLHFLLATFLLIFGLFGGENATAQNSAGIMGNLSDSTTGLPVKLASVTVINPSDSMLVTFGRTDGAGDFKLKLPKAGSYLVLYSHPSFASYIENLFIPNEMTNLGNRYVITRAEMLEAAFVRQQGNIFIKGDTLEYLLDSIKLDESASVEDLLKVLPGMEIDKDGNITAQGEKVEKVLVDGEEFFGNDPTMVTRNLNANTVKKVQVYEKKSEQAEFTGIDDGNSSKTIDIKLKDDMNKGTFGKIALHDGRNKIYNNFAMLNNFKGKRKFNIYGIANSNGESGISWSEMKKYGMNTNRIRVDDDIVYYDANTIEYYGSGLPKAANIGANYINKWNDKHELKISGTYGSLGLIQRDSAISNNYYDNSAFANENSDSSKGRKQKVDAMLEYKWNVDSMNIIGINANGSILQSKNELFEKMYNKLLSNQQLVSSNENEGRYKDTSLSSNTQVYWKHKFTKIGRTLSLFGNLNTSNKNFLDEKKLLTNYKGEINNSLQNISGYDNSINKGGKIAYTEPIYKESWLMELSLDYQNTNSKTQYFTRASELGGTNYVQYDSLSNDFLFERDMLTTGINVQFKNKKIHSTLGGEVGYGSFTKTDYLRPQNNQSYTRVNFFPRVRFRYSFSQFKQISIRYSGNTKQPSLVELQPNYDYSNPLQITRGNPNLDQEYNQNINMNFWNYDAFKDQSFWIGASFNNTYNSISRVTSFDTTLGRSVSSYTNLDGRFSFNQYMGGSFKLKNERFKLRPSLNSNYSKYPFFTDGVLGYSRTTRIGPGLGIAYDIEKKLNTSLGIEASYLSTKSDLSNLSNSYWTFEPSFNITYRPVEYIRIGSDIEYLFRQKTPPFLTDFTRTMWNAYVAGFVDQDKRIEIKFTAHDILNQNNGYDRSAFNNSVNENFYLTIKRYFMLGVTYNFARGPVAQKQNPGGEEEGGHF